MPLLPRLTAALAVLFLLASCGSSPPRVIEQRRPLPAEYAVRCPAPGAAPPLSGEVDPVALELNTMYALYGLCAGRLVDLLDWIDGGQH